MRDRDVLLLTGSYTCMNYVFYLIANWCFLYLVQERHFTLLEGGWLASAPPLAARSCCGPRRATSPATSESATGCASA